MGRARVASALVLVLDCDGTLVSIEARPELGCPDGEVITRLRNLAAEARTEVHVVSGVRGRR